VELRKYQLFIEHRRTGDLKTLISFSLPAFLGSVLIQPVHLLAQTILARQPDGYSQVALLGIAMQWISIVAFLPTSISRVMLAGITSAVASKQRESVLGKFNQALIINLAAGLPLALLMMVFDDLILTLYGINVADAGRLMVAAGIAAAFSIIQGPAGNFVAAASRMWVGFFMNLGWAFSFLGIAYFIGKNGAVGVVLSLALAYALHAVWAVWYSYLEISKL
jgi:O-antigen/teichoic acid export membrane protein